MEIKDCPFCGKQPEIVKWHKYFKVECVADECDINPYSTENTRKQSMLTWNARTLPTKPDKEAMLDIYPIFGPKNKTNTINN